MKLDECYFGILLPIHSGSKNDKLSFKEYNIFDNLEVRRSISIYKRDKIQVDDPLFFCFSAFWSRSQYEYYISDGYKKSEKIDVYKLYIEPNREYLMSIIDMISLKDCKKWLKENKYGR